MSGLNLINAIKDDNPILAKKLLDQNIPVNSEDSRGNTALINAAWKGYSEIVRDRRINDGRWLRPSLN